ncbi:hypothetical protein MPL3356_70135 [Mesorhizobium plurifarium]|uniref:Uncharacterized protein n=1 Tax=Mesorhizobium plurifarium TaxID=69974 RepID=A0A090EC41_MESPL|nr:hypothetical protein MPL3356_70135 [Mesorhizobium plurifarium]
MIDKEGLAVRRPFSISEMIGEGGSDGQSPPWGEMPGRAEAGGTALLWLASRPAPLHSPIADVTIWARAIP